MFNGSDRFEIVSNADLGGWPAEFDAALQDMRPSLLIVTAYQNQPEMAAMVRGADFRILDAVPLAEMAERLRKTVGVDALLVDLRGLAAPDPRLDAALTTLLAWPAWGDTRPLLIVDVGALDAVAAMLGSLDGRLDRLLCDPMPSEIGLALCLLMRDSRAAPHLSDIGRESDTARLEQLSEEVRRLARTIDRLVHEEKGDPARDLREPGQDYAAAPPAANRAVSPPREMHRDAGGSTTRAEVRALLQLRRLRERFLPPDLFADPAWDMMLDLMAARLDGKRVSVSSLCIAAAVPPTTALRWITQLTERGIFERSNDPDDARRVFISLSEEATDSLASWFSAARGLGLRFTG